MAPRDWVAARPTRMRAPASLTAQGGQPRRRLARNSTRKLAASRNPPAFFCMVNGYAGFRWWERVSTTAITDTTAA